MSARAESLPRPIGRWPAVDSPAASVAAAALLVGAVLLAQLYGWRQAMLFLLGGGLGATLFHAAFGFAGSWRNFILHRRAAAIRAQALMIGVAAVAFLPLIAQGSLFGRPLVGAMAPVGVSVLVGAALFGLGMQLGGGCGSGTLYTVGGGSRRMLLTLTFFIVGAVLGTLHLPWWLSLPSFGPIGLGASLGVLPAMLVTLAVLALLAWGASALERRRYGPAIVIAEPAAAPPNLQRLLRGPWPLIWGGVALALLNVATLALAGHPWTITFAFGLWGAKILAAFGVAVQDWTFWTWPQTAQALHNGVLHDVTSVMDFGLLLGAGLAAALAGKFAPAAKLPLGSALAAVLGGLLMGYGARLAFGCNIGALFSGIASGSLHGWLWLAAAFVGNVVGVRLRPVFGMRG